MLLKITTCGFGTTCGQVNEDSFTTSVNLLVIYLSLSFKTLNVLFKWIWKNKACYLKMAFQIVEVMRLVMNFLEMMNAGHETGRNTSDLFSYEHASALKVTMMILTHWKICSESPKRRHSCPHEIYWLSLINTSYWYLQNILIHFHCFSNGLSSNNLFCDGSLPNSLLERLIFSAGAVQTQKSFSGHSVSLPAQTCLTLFLTISQQWCHGSLLITLRYFRFWSSWLNEYSRE